ncbi:MAG: F0F1 ATP synthase subunit gamma, partial [Pseudomonadota bacterium]
MEASRPYAERIRNVIAHLSQANPDYRHPWLDERDVKRVGYIVVSSDRGLCGGLNVNLFKLLIAEMTEWQNKGVEVELALIGSKAVQLFNRLGGSVQATVTQLGDRPQLNDLLGLIKTMLDLYSDGNIDRLFLTHNQFVSAISQKPKSVTLLPVSEIESEDELQQYWDYIYEPEAAELLDDVLMRYIESQIYRGVVENYACEMAAKMVAMKSATDNAGDLIDSLQLQYNKARQAAITQEISEIVGGAAAVSG